MQRHHEVRAATNLLTVPEPFSKGVATVMTAALIAYVGLDTFWSMGVRFGRKAEQARTLARRSAGVH